MSDEEEGRFLCETGGSEEDMVGLTTKGSWRWWEEEGLGREPAMEGGREGREVQSSGGRRTVESGGRKKRRELKVSMDKEA